MKFYISTLFIFVFAFSFGQNTIPKVLEKYNQKTVPYISVEELKSVENYILLDSRELLEYNVSHIENAIQVGYDKFNAKKIPTIIKDKSAKIIVYCSIGIRSEKIGEKLLKMGYKNVSNLYGGIFEWKNKGGKLVDNDNKETNNVHTFDKEWSKYLEKGTKIYDK